MPHSRRPALSLIFILCLRLALTAAPAHAESTTIAMDPLRVNRFPVVAFDAQVTLADVPVKGLTTRDFTLAEDGAEVAAFTVTVVAEPANVALVIDASGSIKEFAGTIRDGARAFVRAMNPADRALVVRFNRDVSLVQKLTDRRDALENAIEGIRPDGGTKLYDGLKRGLEELDGPKKYAVLFTDGRDARTDADVERYSKTSLDEAIALARERKIAVFVIGVGDVIDDTVLGRIAKETGGRYLKAADASKIVQAYEDVAALLNYRYRFEYRSPRPEPDGKERTVRLARKDGSAEATRTYRVTPEMIVKDPPRPGPGGEEGAGGGAGAAGAVKIGADVKMGEGVVKGADGYTVEGPRGFAAGSTEGFFVPDGRGGRTWVPGVKETVVPDMPDTVVPDTPDVKIPVPGDVTTDVDVATPDMPAPSGDAPGDDSDPPEPAGDE